MKLLLLTLTNFKGVRDLTVGAMGANISIFADNGIGKTTVADAIFWLLFGKDSLNRTKFEIKTIDPLTGESMRGLEHSVEADFEVGGTRLTLKRLYKETYTKKRGAAVAEFTGHTEEFWVNTVPVSAGEYARKVDSICPEKTFRLLTDPMFFNGQLTWQDRRKMLIETCGDVSDADVIALTKGLEELPALLAGRTIDEFRKIAAQTKAKLNESLKQIPARISEVDRILKSYGEAKADTERIEELRRQVRALLDRRALAQSGGAAADKTVELRNAEAEISRILTEIRSSAGEARQEAIARISDYSSLIAAKASDIRVLRSQADSKRQEAARIDTRLNVMRDRYRAISDEGYAGATSCAACGQDLPEDRVQAAREKFNQSKAERLEQNKAEGKALKAEQTALIQDAESLEAQIVVAEHAVAELEQIKARVVVPDAAQVDPTQNPAYAQAVAAKAKIEEELAEIRLGAGAELARLDGEISRQESELRELEAAAAAARQRQDAQSRIEQLREEERDLAAQFEQTERGLYLTDEFIRAKVEMLTDRINGRFQRVRFKLFDVQVNGGVQECCEATVDGVPYGSLNHGMRVNAGLDVINTLQAHRGFNPFVIIDGCESVTRLLPMACQVIRLVVSEPDKSLRIVTESATPAPSAPLQEELYA